MVLQVAEGLAAALAQQPLFQGCRHRDPVQLATAGGLSMAWDTASAALGRRWGLFSQMAMPPDGNVYYTSMVCGRGPLGRRGEAAAAASCEWRVCMCARACRSACSSWGVWHAQGLPTCAMYRVDLDLGSLLAPSDTEGVWGCLVPPAVVVSSCVGGE